MTQTQNPGPEKRVAIIAIHGVGEHEPGETANAVARQLLTVCDAHYSDLESSRLTLSVEASALFPTLRARNSEPPPSGFARLRRGLDSAYCARAKPEELPVDQRFTAAVLAGGEDKPQPAYATFCRSLLREENEQRARVDIHEMYWSDISHGQVSGNWKIFEQFSQLLLHIAGLGRTTLALVAGDTGQPAWRRMYQISAFGYWLLTMPIVQGNLLFVLLACLMALPGLLSKPTALAATFGVVFGLSVAFLIAAGIYRAFTRASIRQPRLQAVPLALLIGIAAGYAGFHWSAGWQFRFLLLFASLVLLSLGHYAMRVYDRSRPGSLYLWHLICALIVLWGAIQFPAEISEPGQFWNWLGHTAEGVFIALLGVWALLFAINLALLVGALILRLAYCESDEQRQSLGTALIAAALPPPLLLSVVLLIWSIGYYAFASLLPTTPTYHPLLMSFFPDCLSPSSFLQAMITKSGTVAFLPYLGLLALATLLIIWAVLPSLKAELFRPGFGQDLPAAARLGNWLNGGFSAMGWAAIFACFGFFILMPAGFAYQLVHGSEQLEKIGYAWMLWIAPAIGAGGATFLAASKLFYKNFSNFFARLRTIVDAALDVDNWLRERPRGETPRLLIFARFLALFKHLRQQDYDKIVIVAHSQGTVVASDFFRFLNYQLSAELGATPIEFFTMGCPLRQLYALRFPLLYGWVRHAANPGSIAPAPDECGVSHWVNAYGSGDYVGRYLWAADDSTSCWLDPADSPAPNAMEFCLGAQAHTHYFDADNQAIGSRLDARLRP